MKTRNLIEQITANYEKHGWKLKKALLKPKTAAELAAALVSVLGEAEVRESTIDALWFSRPSHNSGEAWELRLVSETPYALFERFESDDSAEKRAETFQDMEDLLRQYAASH